MKNYSKYKYVLFFINKYLLQHFEEIFPIHMQAIKNSNANHYNNKNALQIITYRFCFFTNTLFNCLHNGCLYIKNEAIIS